MTKDVLSTSGISAAALFRTIAAYHPSLTIDEADTFLKDNEDLRGVLNAGFERGGAVIRCVGDDAEPRIFECLAPVALAGIGKLPETIMDRCIVVPMQRRLPSEKVEPFRRAARASLAEVARRCARWAVDNLDALRGVDPAVPAELDDRAADILGPLFAIADQSGGQWPARARDAAVGGLTGRRDEEQSNGTRLLADIRDIFEGLGADRIATADLLAALVALDERPWSDYRRGKAINARQLAASLKGYGVRSRTLGTRGEGAKGYLLADFGGAFLRYLPPAAGIPGFDPSTRRQPLQPNESLGCGVDGSKNEKGVSTDQKNDPSYATPTIPSLCRSVDVSTDRIAEIPAPEVTDAEYEAEERRAIQSEGEV